MSCGNDPASSESFAESADIKAVANLDALGAGTLHCRTRQHVAAPKLTCHLTVVGLTLDLTPHTLLCAAANLGLVLAAEYGTAFLISVYLCTYQHIDKSLR